MNKKITTLLSSLAIGTMVLTGCGTQADPVEEQEVEQTNEEKPADDGSQKEAEDKNSEDNVEKESESTEGEDKDVVTQDFEGITFEVPNYAESYDTGIEQFASTAYMFDKTLGNNFNVIIEELPEQMTVKEYLEIAKSQTGFEYISEDFYTSNDIKWAETVSVNQTDNGEVKLNQRVFVNDTKVYVFTYGGTPDNYDEYEDEFKKVTDSVKISE